LRRLHFFFAIVKTWIPLVRDPPSVTVSTVYMLNVLLLYLFDPRTRQALKTATSSAWPTVRWIPGKSTSNLERHATADRKTNNEHSPASCNVCLADEGVVLISRRMLFHRTSLFTAFSKPSRTKLPSNLTESLSLPVTGQRHPSPRRLGKDCYAIGCPSSVLQSIQRCP